MFSPAPPFEVNTVDTIRFTFDYNSPFGNFKIFARPFENGNLKIVYAAFDSEIHDEKSGSGKGFIIYNQPSSFDQVRFQFQSYLVSVHKVGVQFRMFEFKACEVV